MRRSRRRASTPTLTARQFVVVGALLVAGVSLSGGHADAATCKCHLPAPNFQHPTCQETRDWPQLVNEFWIKRAYTGGLNDLMTDNFESWACFKGHSCLATLNTCEDDWMCFVYHENDRRWVTWGLQSELNLIQPDGHYTGVNCTPSTTPAPAPPPATTPTMVAACANLVRSCGIDSKQACDIVMSTSSADSSLSWVSDGTTNSSMQCVATTVSNDPWLRVDLGRLARIDAVKVYGASGNPMSSFDIRVSTTPLYSVEEPVCATGLSTATSDNSVEAVCPSNLLGRYVFIAVPGAGKKLTVCELEVSGDAPLNVYEWLVTGQPSFVFTISDYANNVLLKLDAFCEGDLQVCGYKSPVTVTANARVNGVWGTGDVVNSKLESELCPPPSGGSSKCIMQFKVTAGDRGFDITWISEGVETSFAFPHRVGTGIRDLKMFFVEALLIPNNPSPTLISTEVAGGGGAANCAPTEAVLPEGTKIYGGGSVEDGAFKLAASTADNPSYTNTRVSFMTGMTGGGGEGGGGGGGGGGDSGDYTYSSVVRFGSASSTSKYAFWGHCGPNYFVFSNPPKLEGCEFGNVNLGSFSAAYGSNFRFSAARRNGKLFILINGEVVLRDFAMAWTVTGMGWGFSDTTITIVSMAAECNDPNILIPLPPASSCLQSDFICAGNLSSAVSVVDERSEPKGGANVCGASYSFGGFTSWSSNSYQVASADVGVRVAFPSRVESGEDFAIESIVLFEEGLTQDKLPWGVAFQFYFGSEVKAPYFGQDLFGFEWNYTWTNGPVIGSSTLAETANRYERYTSAPGMFLRTNSWYKVTFLRTGGELTVLLDGQWVLMQTVMYSGIVNGVGWRSGRTTMRVRQLRRVAVGSVVVPVMPTPPPAPVAIRAQATVTLMAASPTQAPFVIRWYHSADGSGATAGTCPPPGSCIPPGAQLSDLTDSVIQKLYDGNTLPSSGVLSAILYAKAPDSQRMTCDPFVTGSVEGARVRLTLNQPKYVVSVKRWMGKGYDQSGGRKFCYQKLSMSSTGAFAGEETVVYSCDQSCPYETDDGLTMPVGATAMYFQFSASRSDVESYVSFTDFQVLVYD